MWTTKDQLVALLHILPSRQQMKDIKWWMNVEKYKKINVLLQIQENVNGMSTLAKNALTWQFNSVAKIKIDALLMELNVAKWTLLTSKTRFGLMYLRWLN